MALILKQQTQASAPTPSTGKATIFLDSADATFKWKDDAGVVHNFSPAVEDVQDIVGAMSTDSATIDFVYDDIGGTLTASVKTGSISAAMLSFDVATQVELDAHINDATDVHAGSAITNTPTGNISATTVQAAINELDTEKQPLDADLTTIAGLTATSDNFLQAKSSAWASRTPTQVTADLIDASTLLPGRFKASEKININSMNGQDSSLAVKRVFRPGDYMVGNTYDPTGTSDSTSSFTAMIAAVVALSDRCVIELPPGVFKVATGIFTGFGSAPITIQGAGRGVTVLIPTSGAGDMILLNASVDGVTIRDFAIYQTGTPQIAGDGIDTNGADSVTIENMLFVNLFNDININGASIKVSIQRTVHSQNNGSATSVGILVSNGAAGDTYIGPDIVMSNTGATRRRASVEITESGHYEITQSNLTGSAQGILIDPGAGKIVAFGFHNQVLCDSCTVNGMTLNAATATSTIKNIKSVNSWYSGTVTGAGQAGILTTGTAGGIINGVTFTNDRFLNNQTHGFQHGFGTDFRFDNCDMKGNSAATSNTSDGLNIAAGVSNWAVLGGKYGGTDGAPTGGNQRWGIFVAVGASAMCSILAADLTGNNTGPLSNGSTSTIEIASNVGMPIVPNAVTSVPLLGTGEVYATLSFPVLKGALQVGMSWRCSLLVTNAATVNTPTIRGKFGTAGTVADGNWMNQALLAGTAVAGIGRLDIVVTCRAIGNGTTSFAWTLTVWNGATAVATGFTGATFQQFQGVTATFNSTVDNFLGIAFNTSAASAVVTIQQAVWEELAI